MTAEQKNALAEIVTIDQEVMHGTPCFAGTRVPIKNLFDYLHGNHSLTEFLEHFPSVTREQVNEVLELAIEKQHAFGARRC